MDRVAFFRSLVDEDMEVSDGMISISISIKAVLLLLLCADVLTYINGRFTMP